MTAPAARSRPTPSEVDAYRTTPDYATTFAYLDRLVADHPDRLRSETFGHSGEGRALRVVVASKDGLFEPRVVHAEGRAVLLIQNGIHAGETDGKDACLALLRDLVEDPALASLLDRVVVVVIPIYNVDGHERRSRFTRMNQNGPEVAGWRANGTNLNLNRDYMKADAPETRAFWSLFRRWRPDFFVDDHVTDGMDFQYDITFLLDDTPDVFPDTAAWVRGRVTPEIVRHVEAAGHLAFPAQVFLRDDSDPARGLAFNANAPRFSTGRMILENRPGLLVEMHMLKDYRTRVTGNYEVLRGLLTILHRDAAQLKALNARADHAAARLGLDRAPFPLVIGATGDTLPVRFRGVEYTRTPSEVSGQTWVQYSDRPVELTLPMETAGRPVVTVTPPAGYVVPPSWRRVLEVLEVHGVSFRRTTAPWTGDVERYHCAGMVWPARPFEGRHPIVEGGNVERPIGRFGTCTPVVEEVTFAAGSAVVALDQPLAKVAVHWLEPMAPDSALRWGFFDAVFEQKESGEAYVVERKAREMLASDPGLRDEFQRRLQTDAAFARDPAARLDFFFDRSPWYVVQTVGVYPVGRLATLERLPLSGPPVTEGVGT